MKLNKLKGISDITEEILIENGITNVSVIQEEGFNPRMYIKYNPPLHIHLVMCRCGLLR